MMSLFPYYMILLLIIFFLYFNLRKNMKFSPQKIKNLFSIVFILGIIRYIIIFINTTIDFQITNQIVKVGCFLNFVYIPTMAMICFYVFLRNNNIDFDVIKRMFIIIVIIYVIMMVALKGQTTMSWEYGYIVGLDKQIIFNGVYLSMLVSIVGYIIMKKKSNVSNLKGISMVIFAIGALIIENALCSIGVKYFPQCLISEFVMFYVCYKAILTFERVKH